MFSYDDDDGNTMALIFCCCLVIIVQFSPPSTDPGVQNEKAYANIWSRS